MTLLRTDACRQRPGPAPSRAGGAAAPTAAVPPRGQRQLQAGGGGVTTCDRQLGGGPRIDHGPMPRSSGIPRRSAAAATASTPSTSAAIQASGANSRAMPARLHPAHHARHPPADQQRHGRIERQQIDAALADGEGVRSEDGDDPEHREQTRVRARQLARRSRHSPSATLGQQQGPRQQPGAPAIPPGRRPSAGDRARTARPPTDRTRFSSRTMVRNARPAVAGGRRRTRPRR